MSTLNRSSQVIIFDDYQVSNNPQLRVVDWRRKIESIPVSNPKTTVLQIDPSAEVQVFNGTRSITLDNTTQIALSLTTVDPTRYRLAWTGTGTTPGFRTSRSVSSSGGSITIVLNANQTVTITHSAGAIFGAVQVGDTCYIPGPSTGDASVFNPLNEGYWNVLSASSTTVVLSRASGGVFSGASQVVAISNNSQFQVFSTTGVQVGDVLDISAGFSVSTRASYRVLAVTASQVDIMSTIPLGAETVLPGATGISIYSSAKRFVYVESDQAVAVKFNGTSDESNRLEPVGSTPGVFEKWGTAFSLSIKNKTTSRASVMVITAE
jgi:hypothetical protein